MASLSFLVVKIHAGTRDDLWILCEPLLAALAMLRAGGAAPPVRQPPASAPYSAAGAGDAPVSPADSRSDDFGSSLSCPHPRLEVSNTDPL